MDDCEIPSLYRIQYEEAVRRALVEDLGLAGDITTDAVLGLDVAAVGRVVARSPGWIAGIDVAAAVFSMLSDAVQVDVDLVDGRHTDAGSVLFRVSGPARWILAGERTALNFLGRLSGIATLTREFVEAVADTQTRVVCTRKTTPGLRALEKYAVRCGGGSNHRFGLDDAVLIKDNHLVAGGDVQRVVERVRAAVGHTVKVELEVDTLEQLEAGLAAGVDAVLLDNMSPDELRRAVVLVDGRAITEASGGITLGNAAEIAATGVDLMSIGALTHSAPSLDVSLELETHELIED